MKIIVARSRQAERMVERNVKRQHKQAHLRTAAQLRATAEQLVIDYERDDMNAEERAELARVVDSYIIQATEHENSKCVNH